MTRAVSPEYIRQARYDAIPDVVFDVWNDMIREKYKNGISRILLRELRERLRNATGLNDEQIKRFQYDSIWDIYQEAGWQLYILHSFGIPQTVEFFQNGR